MNLHAYGDMLASIMVVECLRLNELEIHDKKNKRDAREQNGKLIRNAVRKIFAVMHFRLDRHVMRTVSIAAGLAGIQRAAMRMYTSSVRFLRSDSKSQVGPSVLRG